MPQLFRNCQMPISDVGAEDHADRAGGQAVEAVGEVHRVGVAATIMIGPDSRTEHGPSDGRSRAGTTAGRGRGGARRRREAERQHARRRRRRSAGRALRRRPQAEAALFEDLDEVVEEADQRRDRPSGTAPAAPETVRPVAVTAVGETYADERRQDEHDAAHGGRAPLARGAPRAVVADELAVARVADQQLDQQRRAEQGRGTAPMAPAKRISFTGGASSRQRARPTLSRPTARDAFTSTTSPGRSRAAGRRPPPRRTRAPTPHPANPRLCARSRQEPSPAARDAC